MLVPTSLKLLLRLFADSGLRCNVTMMLSVLLKRGFLFTLGIVAVPGLIACGLRDMHPNTSIVSPVPATLVSPLPSIVISSPSPVASASLHITPDVFITPAQSGQIIELSRGQIIGVASLGSAMEWQVDYASEVLEILTPPEKLHTPGPDGWLFRAIALGQTDLAFTSIPQSCSNSTPCPPMPARFVFAIDVK